MSDNLSQEEIKNQFINTRWEQLYTLSKDEGESAIKYLFNVNSGGAIAVLTYLGAVVDNNVSHQSLNIALLLFFLGIIVVGIYKAYTLHYYESLFQNYILLVQKYIEKKITWHELLQQDEAKVSNPKTPYILGYASFLCFITGCICGVSSFI